MLGLASCQTEPEGLDVNVGGAVDTTITVSIPETETRYGENSNSAGSVFTNGVLSANDVTMRYIFQVYYNNGDQIVESQAVPQVKYSDETSVNFHVRLVPNRDYTFVVWADVVKKDQQGNWADLHYNTRNDEGKITLNNITVNEDTWVAMDESRDAFTVTKVIEDYTGTSEINLELKRPLAKLRVKTTDMKVLKDLQIKPKYATVEYTSDLYNTFNAVDGTVSGTMRVSETGYEIAAYSDNDSEGDEQSMILFTDYVFAPKDQDGAVRFDLTVYDEYGTDDDVNRIKYSSFSTDIKTHRNYLTTISGNVLTDGNNINVKVEDAFVNVENNGNTTDPNYDYKTISSVAELLKAIDSNSGEYILISDLDVNSITASTQAATRTAGVGATINLNGYTITLKTNLTIAEGKTLTINDINENGENGAIVSEGGQLVNNGTLNIEGGYFGADTIENNNGVVNITGGTINGDLSDFVPDGYDVEENEDGSYTVTESDPVAQIGNETYTTLQAAFDAVNDEATITLLRDARFKNTSVLANGKTVVLDLYGTTLSATDKNVIRNDGGNLTIKNGTITRTGDVVGYSVNNASGEITVENATITRGLYTSGSKMTATNANISHEQSSRHAIYAWNCEVTINSGTYHNDNAGNATLMASGSSVVTINGGTFSIADGRETLSWTSCLMDQNGTAKITVNGGEFNGGFRINSADTTLTIEGGEFNTNNGSGYTYYNGTVSIKGGTYTDAAAIAFAEKYVAEGYVLDGDTVVLDVKVAKVGNTEYRKIDDAIAAWTNGTTLTLLGNVTLSDVVKLNSTEHHILNLSTYTMTAAEGKNAFEIIAKGTGASERTAITIKADANNPGSINAGSKSVVYYNYANGTATGDDRPIIKIEGGIFRGATSSFGTAGIYFKGGSAARHAATLNISGGEFYCSINGQSKSKLLISGGLFHYSVGSQGDSTALRLISGGTFKTLGFMTADSNNTKFWFGTSMANSNVGLYINDDNYLVVGGPVITEFGDKFAAKATNATKWNSLLQYSSAATNGLYYTNADMAISKHGEANVELK